MQIWCEIFLARVQNCALVVISFAIVVTFRLLKSGGTWW